MNYSSVSNLSFDESGCIFMTVNFDGVGEVPFTASPNDIEAHGRELYSRAASGDFGVVSPYEKPPAVRVVPRSVSRFQARAALLQAGLLGDVEAYMALPETDPIYRLAWQDAQDFFRNSETVNALKSALMLSDSQLDDLFVFAGSITG